MMEQFMCFLIGSIIVLFAYNLIVHGALIEPLENNSANDNSSSSGGCQAKTLVYKNSGSIQALQDKMKQVMDKVNKLIMSNDKHTNSIQQLQTMETKYDKLATQADDLANDNKQRLLQMAKQAKAKYDSGAKASDKQPSP